MKYTPAFKVFITKYSSILVDTTLHLAKSLFWLGIIEMNKICTFFLIKNYLHYIKTA